MYNLIQLLRNIGLSEKEAITYITNLKIGPNPASVIAKNTNLNRSTIYIILESLKKKELILEFEKNRITYYSAADPIKLINFINAKRRNLTFYKEEICAVLPKFEMIKCEKNESSYAKSYNDSASVKELFNKILKENDLYIYCIKNKHKSSMFLDFLTRYINTETGHIKIIINSNRNIEKHIIKNQKQIRHLPSCFPAEISGSNSMIFTVSTNSYGVEINNPEILRLFRKKFKSLWNQIK